MPNKCYETHAKIDILLTVISTAWFVGSFSYIANAKNYKFAFLTLSNIFEIAAIISALLSLISISNYELKPNDDTTIKITWMAGMSFFSLLLAFICVIIFKAFNLYM